ncbi:MAG: ABC transporter permease [Candidatus Eisenbacteria bacterium]
MLGFVFRRVLHLVPVLLGVSLLSFVLLSLAPGDFLSSMEMDPLVSKETIQEMRSRFALDRSWPEQFAGWFTSILLRFDFGHSFSRHLPVSVVMREAIGNTLLLTVSGAFITWLVAIPLGVLCALKRGGATDRLASVAAYAGISMPEVLLALLAILLAAKTGLFPIGGARSLEFESLSAHGKLLDVGRHLLLPALVLSAAPAAARMRQMRANMLDVLGSDFVTAGRARGLSERRVIMVHALRNALNPMITLFGYTVAGLLSGTFIVEVVMGWPGLGRVTFEALLARDVYLVMGSLVMAACMLVAGNLAADLLLAAADPRVRFSKGIER